MPRLLRVVRRRMVALDVTVDTIEGGAVCLAVTRPREIEQRGQQHPLWIEMRIEVVPTPSQHQPTFGGFERQRRDVGADLGAEEIAVVPRDKSAEALGEGRNDRAGNQVFVEVRPHQMGEIGYRRVRAPRVVVRLRSIVDDERVDRRDGRNQCLVHLVRKHPVDGQHRRRILGQRCRRDRMCDVTGNGAAVDGKTEITQPIGLASVACDHLFQAVRPALEFPAGLCELGQLRGDLLYPGVRLLPSGPVLALRFGRWLQRLPVCDRLLNVLPPQGPELTHDTETMERCSEKTPHHQRFPPGAASGE